MTKKITQAGKRVVGAAVIVRGKVAVAVAKMKVWANSNPIFRIGGGRTSFGQAPQKYRNMGIIGKVLNPISGHLERSKGILTLNWFGKKVGKNYKYHQWCIWGKC